MKYGEGLVEVDYVDGKIYENGQKDYEIDYVDGLKHGKYIKWYENGQRDYEIDYVNGKSIY